MSHSHSSWSALPPLSTPSAQSLSAFFVLLALMNNDLIHARQDGLVDWPYEVRSHQRFLEHHAKKDTLMMILDRGAEIQIFFRETQKTIVRQNDSEIRRGHR